MEKFFRSKFFVILTPIITLAMFFVAGIFLSYIPYVSGKSYTGSGITYTTYIFRIRNAIGIWLIGIAVSILVLLVCILISKINSKSVDDDKL